MLKSHKFRGGGEVSVGYSVSLFLVEIDSFVVLLFQRFLGQNCSSRGTKGTSPKRGEERRKMTDTDRDETRHKLLFFYFKFWGLRCRLVYTKVPFKYRLNHENGFELLKYLSRSLSAINIGELIPDE